MRLARIESEEKDRRRKEDKARQAQERAASRRGHGQERAKKLRAYLRDLEAKKLPERLSFLATDDTFPLEAVPEELIAGAVHEVSQLAAEIRAGLLSRLDRRKASRWRRLRRVLSDSAFNGLGGLIDQGPRISQSP